MSDYTGKHIQKLSQFEHIRENPGMYIGETKHPLKLIDEILDNALDEITAGHGDLVNIIIKNDGSITIIDNGRGIPLDFNEQEQKYIPEMIVTELFTSGKFRSNKEKQYKCSIGIHGVGATVVNALSDSMVIMVKRKDKVGKFVFKDGQVLEKNVIDQKNDVTGTFVSFIPSKKYFDYTTDLNIDSVILKLKFASVINPKLKALIKVEGKPDINIIDINLKTIYDFSFKNNFTDSLFPDYTVINVEDKITTEKMIIAFNYDVEKTDVKFVSSVNLANINAGTHINITKSILIESLSEILNAEQRKILKNDDLVIGLRCLVITFLDDSRFSSQSKEKLTTKDESFDKLKEMLKKELIKYFKSLSAEDKDTLISKFINYRNSLEMKTISKRKNKKRCQKLTDSLDNVDTTLFIVEGDSAGGSCVQARDKHKHAIFPLRGKVLNVEKANINKIIKNETIMDLLNVIEATEFVKGQFIDTGYCKYDRIVFMADADVDGKHILTILCKLFKELMPRLIEEGRVFVAEMPLYGRPEKKDILPVYDLEEANKYLASGVKLYRYKGLGEMDPEKELAQVMYGKYKRWIQLTNEMIG